MLELSPAGVAVMVTCMGLAAIVVLVVCSKKLRTAFAPSRLWTRTRGRFRRKRRHNK